MTRKELEEGIKLFGLSNPRGRDKSYDLYDIDKQYEKCSRYSYKGTIVCSDNTAVLTESSRQ